MRYRLVPFPTASSAIFVLVCISIAASTAAAQRPTDCFAAANVAKLKRGIGRSEDKKKDDGLRKSLIDARTAFEKQYNESRAEVDPDAAKNAGLRKPAEQATTAVCRALTNRWPSAFEIGREGEDALMYLISRALSPVQQRSLYPAVLAAAENESIAKDESLAVYLDKVRLQSGGVQLFGTQAFVKGGFLQLAPIGSVEETNDARRRFGLGALDEHERRLEMHYRLPLFRALPDGSTAHGKTRFGEELIAERGQSPAPIATVSELGGIEEEAEVQSVDTFLVKVDVMVSKTDGAPQSLAQQDFHVYEDDSEVPIDNFSKSDAPFDITLLIDLSGSTSKKLDLIRTTTRHFVERKRSVDRIAVVTFADDPTIVSRFEFDRGSLLGRIGEIKGSGGSNIWDALKFSLDELDPVPDPRRRRAIVLITDGLDSSLLFEQSKGSKTRFSELVESVRKKGTSVSPIFLELDLLDPISAGVQPHAERTLTLIAKESGGTMYRAKRLENLAGIYEQVLSDLGQVYSLEFSPKNEAKDKTWRRLRVELSPKHRLRLRHREGYYAN